ncbi:MAG TPA: ferritin-like domain-containing protein [Methylomirabilota bacterium]|nr:ferritin-like domain-containing protein [Methylomirabilota bacterium]
MPAFDLDSYVGRSRAVDLAAIDWADVPRHPVPSEVVRTLRYMQDIESHTIIYLRVLLATRAIDDPDVATFLACWVYEETFHGIALARFLEAAGSPVGERPMPRGQEPLGKRIEAAATAMVSKAWPDFCAVHMTWGAINELTTLTGYRRLAARCDHPVLTDLLERIILDESRHFFFYYRQAEIRLQRRAVARVARLLVDRFWSPVGTGVQPEAELRFLATYLFAGPEGRAAARKVDDTIRRLPGFETVRLLESWMDRHVGNIGDRSPAQREGGRNGHRNH